MPRSLKKGPFLDAKLKKKLDTLNDSGDKKVIKHLNVVLRNELTS